MLKEIIDKFYLDRQKDREQHHFYVTDAGKCPRQIFFRFKNVPKKEMEARILRVFDHGDHIHELIMGALLGSRDIHVISSEVNIPPQELISGRADAIISDGNKDLYVLDIKSINSMGFRSLTQPKKENTDQIQLYLHYLKIPKGILLYVNKDSQELKEFLVSYNQAQVQSLLENLTVLKEQIDCNVVPSRIPDHFKNWQCRYCQFKEICKIAEAGEMKWEDFKKKIESQNQN